MKKPGSLLNSLAAIFLAISMLLAGSVNAFGLISLDDLTPYWTEGDKIIGVSGMDLSHLDLRGKLEVLKTLTFDTNTIWPSSDRMPEGFDPQEVLEWGKKPGLGIKKLHDMGYTGKGVNIAYIDQPIREDHIEFLDSNIIYTKIRPETLGMQSGRWIPGNTSLSILAGKNTGVAPDSTVFFFGHPTWIEDQSTNAEALEKIIEINKTLPEDQKIRVVGLSDEPYPRVKNSDAYAEAIKKAEDSGIMVINRQMPIGVLEIQYPSDKDNPKSYRLAHRFSPNHISNLLWVPANGITTASDGNPSHFIHWTDGFVNLSIPYIVGTIALGLQVDPQLTKQEAVSFLYQSGTPYRNGKIINPEGFLNLVKENMLQNRDIDYTVILYNRNRVTSSDKYAIEKYAASLFDGKSGCVLIDTSGYNTAASIYAALKETAGKYRGKIKGIQIFGSSEDVPAFDILLEDAASGENKEGSTFKSDFLYSNLRSDITALSDAFSISKTFKQGAYIRFMPQWPVARLPLRSGEIAPFIEKCYDYSDQTQGKEIPYVSFSSPVSQKTSPADDMGYFISKRLDKEFNLLGSNQYRLYGNIEGEYPVTVNVLGRFDNSLLSAENGKGIAHFIINAHGQQDRIDQCIFFKYQDLFKYSKYKDRITDYFLHGDLWEFRISFLTKYNLNNLLSSNYYTLTLLTSFGANNLQSDSLACKALALGKAVDAIAPSSMLSRQGMDNSASLDNLRKNNLFYFIYEFFNSQNAGYSRSESFFNAQRQYAIAIMGTASTSPDNARLNMHNVLSFHYLGLLDFSRSISEAQD